MTCDYLTDGEYEAYWYKLEGIRERICERLGLHSGMTILDVGTGYALFAIEMAKQLKKGQIIGIDIVNDGVYKAKKLTRDRGVADVVSIVKMDAVKLALPSDLFDLATSFLGMRDIYMTRGRAGVEKAVEEMIRVVKPNGKIMLCITPPEDMETEDQKVAVELEGDVFGAKSLPKRFYTDIFDENNVTLEGVGAFFTNKKMTANQTRTEIKDGMEVARRIYGRKMPSFEEVWAEYGNRIKTSGYGMYSKIITLEAYKGK
jgi:ubiquinone/menaquinone biosynthesis C-methylase UbiE